MKLLTHTWLLKKKKKCKNAAVKNRFAIYMEVHKQTLEACLLAHLPSAGRYCLGLNKILLTPFKSEQSLTDKCLPDSYWTERKRELNMNQVCSGFTSTYHEEELYLFLHYHGNCMCFEMSGWIIKPSTGKKKTKKKPTSNHWRWNLSRSCRLWIHHQTVTWWGLPVYSCRDL